MQNITVIIALYVSSLICCLAQKSAYITESIPFPEGEVIEVGCLCEMKGDRIAIGTRFGEVWIVDGAYDEDLSKVKWTRFATGLHEPFGIFERGDSLVVTQRPEVTVLRDNDKDGTADEYKTLCDDWGYSAAPYEWAWGADPDKEGNMWVLLTLSGSVSSDVLYRGWALKVTPEGEMIPAAAGVRSPGGTGYNSEGELFYSDNQGFWNGSSAIKHLEVGKHMGAHSANKWYGAANFGPEPPAPLNKNFEDYRKQFKDTQPPALVVPHHRMSRSPTQIVADTTGGKFGPFADQLIFGEVTNAELERGFLEKVNGVYQGSVFRLSRDVGSGPVSLRLSKNGYLFVGQTTRGWGGSGKAPQALERVKWNGEAFFDIKHISVSPVGFDLHFTEPVDLLKAQEKANYLIEAWTYPYGDAYGGPETDKQNLTVNSVTVSPDGKVVQLAVEGRVKGHLHEISFPNITSKSNEKPYNDRGWYTLNEIPASPEEANTTLPADWRKLPWAEKERVLTGYFTPKGDALNELKSATGSVQKGSYEKTFKALMMYRCEGFAHDSIETTNKAISLMAESTGAFTVTKTDKYEDLYYENLSQYDVLIMNNATNLAVNEHSAVKESILKFLSEGKGYVGIHAATAAYYGWPEGQKILGGVFAAHPWNAPQSWAFKLESPEHPVLKGFAQKGFWMKDEIYMYTPGSLDRDRSRVLVSMDFSKEENGQGHMKEQAEEVLGTDIKAYDIPVSWIHRYDKGRVFYTNFGHNVETFNQVKILQHIYDGLQYSAGNLLADDMPSNSLEKVAVSLAPPLEG